MKAFGYSNAEIAWHYLKSSLIIALVGALVGAVAGNWMGSGLAKLYSEFYRFPTFVFFPDVRVNLVAIGISLLAAVVGSYRAVRTAAAYRPPKRCGRRLRRSIDDRSLERLGSD